VHAANIHDSLGAAGVLVPVKESQPRLEVILADQGYRGGLGEEVKMPWVGKWKFGSEKVKDFKWNGKDG
jgi:hypothetical protein